MEGCAPIAPPRPEHDDGGRAPTRAKKVKTKADYKAKWKKEAKKISDV